MVAERTGGKPSGLNIDWHPDNTGSNERWRSLV
jgi:hypothetical protein